MASRLFHESYRSDVEDRLTQTASYPSQTDYTYNGGGDLVRRASSSGQYPGAVDEKNVYVDGIYEQQCFSGGAPIATKRYEAFGRVFAERRSTPVPGPSTLTYLLSDHLNSTVGTTTTASEAVDRMQYYPFGSVRSGGVATDRTYTGQQTEAGSALKLSYYHARFYSAELGHFVSADTLTVDGLNRYAYARNSPVRRSDPTGHCVEFFGTQYDCSPGVRDSNPRLLDQPRRMRPGLCRLGHHRRSHTRANGSRLLFVGCRFNSGQISLHQRTTPTARATRGS